MRIGFTFDSALDHLPPEGAPEDWAAEFDGEETIAAICEALSAGGHEVLRIGPIQQLVALLAAGERPDLVFNIAEGRSGRGREAAIPALLEAYGIPYTFSDPLTLALCLDKAMTKRVWQQAGLPTPAFCEVAPGEALDPGLLPPLPVFVKPSCEGASKGVSARSVAFSLDEAARLVEAVHTRYKQPALVEELLPGREFTVSVIGEGASAHVLGMLEIIEVSQRGQPLQISGYAEKTGAFVPGETYLPVGDAALAAELADIALRAYRAVGCRDSGRLDLRCDASGRVSLLEINPLAGLDPLHSALPACAEQADMSFNELIALIVAMARERSPRRVPEERLYA